MGRSRRSHLAIEASVEASRLAAVLGRELRAGRRRRHLTQAACGARVGLGQPRISEIELGRGQTASLGTWVMLGLAVGRPLAVSLTRALGEEEYPADAGHLEIQEFLLTLPPFRAAVRRVELPTRPIDPSRSIDVAVIDDRRRVILVIEAWNRFGDLGAAIRATNRKVAEAQGLVAVREGETGTSYRVAACWVVRATAANRALVRRYPAVLRAALPASSRRWASALTAGAEPPLEPGLVWFDAGRGSVIPMRLGSRD